MPLNDETINASSVVEAAWEHMQGVCEYRNASRDDEGQGRICEHADNSSGMEWCDPSHCPLLHLN